MKNHYENDFGGRLDEAEYQFQKNDLVIVEIKGYPNWPGYITSIYPGKKYKVELYCAKSYIIAEERSMALLDSEFLDALQTKSKIPKYRQALTMARKKMAQRVMKQAKEIQQIKKGPTKHKNQKQQLATLKKKKPASSQQQSQEVIELSSSLSSRKRQRNKDKDFKQEQGYEPRKMKRIDKAYYEQQQQKEEDSPQLEQKKYKEVVFMEDDQEASAMKVVIPEISENIGLKQQEKEESEKVEEKKIDQ